MRHITALLVLLALCSLFLTGCAGRLSKEAQKAETVASLDDDDEFLDKAFDAQLIADPIEPWNRGVFIVNDKIIRYVARPVNTAYTTVIPSKLRNGIGNFFHNLLFPVRFTNSLLQGKGRDAGLEFARFIINTTAGVGGFHNAAAEHREFDHLPGADFGQTLGVWGVGNGLYIYWPLLGPSTGRDTVGLAGDWLMDPLTYLHWSLSMSLKGTRTINQLDAILDIYDDVVKSAIEPYTAVRDGYIQYRNAKIQK